MAESAITKEALSAPRIIKISSKRQITIPADMYKRSHSPEYALVTWHDNGNITLEPLAVRNENASVKILRSLVEKGLEGDDLISEYETIINRIIDFNKKVDEALNDVDEGRAFPFEDLQSEIEENYAL